MKTMKIIIPAMLNYTMVVIFLFGCVSMQSKYEAAQKVDTIAAYRAFLQDCKNGEYSNLARNRIDELELEEWNKAVNENSIYSYTTFIENYPNNDRNLEARNKLDKALKETSMRWVSNKDLADFFGLCRYCQYKECNSSFAKSIFGEPLRVENRNNTADWYYLESSEVIVLCITNGIADGLFYKNSHGRSFKYSHGFKLQSSW